MITSIANPAVREIRRLRKRAWRERRALYLVEGHRAVAAGIAVRARIEEILVTPAGLRLRTELLADARGAGIRTREVSEFVMTHLTSSTSLPDMLGIAPMRRATLRSAGAPAVLLSQVRDPANAGSILAAAVAHGIGTVIAASGSVDPFEQKCVRAARGAHFSLQVVSGADEKEVIEHYRAAGARVIAIGTDGAAPWRTDLRGPVLFVVHGEEPLERIGALCDELVAIPRGEVELGVAVRAANVLYERARQEDER